MQPGMMVLVLRIETVLKTGGRRKILHRFRLAGVDAKAGRLENCFHAARRSRSEESCAACPSRPSPIRSSIRRRKRRKRKFPSALAAAAKQHKRVILVFGGNWCYDCHVLDATFRSKDFAPIVNASYIVIHINVGNYDANLDLADKYQIPLKKGVPSLAILDPDGSLVVSQKQGEFESTVRIGPEDVLEFLKKWKPHNTRVNRRRCFHAVTSH